MLKVEYSAILSTFIKLTIVSKIFLSIFEWLFYTRFTIFSDTAIIGSYVVERQPWVKTIRRIGGEMQKLHSSVRCQ